MNKILTLAFPLTFQIIWAQKSGVPFISPSTLLPQFEEIPSASLINPDFIKQYNVKSIAIKKELGDIGLAPPQDFLVNHSQSFDITRLGFNVDGNLEKKLYIFENERQDTVEADIFNYDVLGKLRSIEKIIERSFDHKRVYYYDKDKLERIGLLDEHGETGTEIKYFRNSDRVARKEDFLDNERLQVEYFFSKNASESILSYIKESEIDNNSTSILIIYLGPAGKIEKEYYHTKFSDYEKRYIYDQLGRITAIKQNDYDRPITQVFKYDTIGNLVQYTYTSQGFPATKITYDYDQQGVFLNTITKITDGEVTDKATLTYLFRY